MGASVTITVNAINHPTLAAEARHASTDELVAIYDYAATLDSTLTGLINQPRCAGLAYAWVDGLLTELGQTQDIIGAVLLTRTDDPLLCVPAIAKWLVPSMHKEDAEALLALLRGVARRAAASAAAQAARATVEAVR